jgi:hypothetical protein
MPTTIADLSNDDSKDGLLKDVYLDKKAKKSKEDSDGLKKKHFGPYHDVKTQ